MPALVGREVSFCMSSRGPRINGERCAQFMCYVGVEAQAFLIQLLFLFMILLFQRIEAFQIYFLFVSVYDEINNADR